MGDGGGSRSLLFCFGGAADHAGQRCSLARYGDPCTLHVVMLSTRRDFRYM